MRSGGRGHHRPRRQRSLRSESVATVSEESAGDGGGDDRPARGWGAREPQIRGEAGGRGGCYPASGPAVPDRRPSRQGRVRGGAPQDPEPRVPGGRRAGAGNRRDPVRRSATLGIPVHGPRGGGPLSGDRREGG